MIPNPELRYKIKYWFGVYFDQWFWVNDCVENWGSGCLHISGKYFKTTHMLNKA